MSQPKIYSGNGQSGAWNDPNNWAGGVAPGPADTVIVLKDAVLNGSVEVSQVMFLGTETITINGSLKTDSTNTCQGVMVCNHSVATFAPGSTVNAAGAFITGAASVGTSIIDGAAGGKAAAVINTAALKVGQDTGSGGTLNVAGILNSTGGSYIGVSGTGTMNVTGSGQVNCRLGLQIGSTTGAVGAVNLSDNAVVTARDIQIGTSVGGAAGGVGTVTVGGNAQLKPVGGIAVDYGSALVMTGGSATAGGANSFNIQQGGTVSGYGHLTGYEAMTDNGTLASAGGTLVVLDNLSGMGAVHVGAGSTLNLEASKITVPAITFMGANATLDLTTGVTGAFDIAGFAASDQIVMNGIDALSWSASTDVLSVSEHGQVMDKLQFSGVPAGMAFHLNQEPSGSVITLISSH